MKNIRFKTVLPVLAIFITFGLTNCKKEQITSGIETNSETQVLKANTATLAATGDALDSLSVSTLYTGFAPSDPVRICSSETETLFVSTNLGTVFKITSQGIGSVVLRGIAGPYGIKASRDGGIYVVEQGNNNIIKGDITGKKQILFEGQNLPIYSPFDVAVALNNTIYVANAGANTILKVTAQGVRSNLAGKTGVRGAVDGTGSNALIGAPSSIKLSKDGNLYIVDSPGGLYEAVNGGRTIRKINSIGHVTTIYTASANKTIMDIAVSKKDPNFKTSNSESLFVIFSDNTISHISTSGVETPLVVNTTNGFVNGKLRNAKFGKLTGITIHGNIMDLVDQENFSIRRIVRMR